MDALNAGTDAIAKIRGRFPDLEFVKDVSELHYSLPVQAGLKHAVWLALQNNDELVLGIGDSFWVEWFPCTDPEQAAKYVEAVCGFLAGHYRLLEHYWRAKCVKAVLQAPSGSAWRPVATWSNLWSLLPGHRSIVEARNA